MDPEKIGLPPYSAVAEEPKGQVRPGHWRRRRGFLRRSRGLRFIGLACLAFIVYAQWRQMPPASSPPDSDSHMTVHGLSVKRLREDLATCAKLHTKPVDPIGLGRERNARYIDGHKPTLIKNATVWVGEPAEGTSPEDARSGKGYSWVTADVFLEHGLIKQVGRHLALQGTLPKDTLVYDAAGRPLTSGIIDMHSHAGVDSLPELRGNDATNEMSSDITPYVKAIDGIQPTDRQIQVIKSGGVTTSLILPGSANNMGGEAFVIKHAVGRADGRNETSIADMLADPDHAWRYLKMACGENAARVYGKPGEHGPTSRLGESWEFRHAFEQASRLLREQDDWCDSAALGLERVDRYLPVEIRWESVIALLRGQVHLNVHCYTIPDLESFVAHTNEFKFPVRAFHHAHQTYLVPEILKRAYGGPPASALFADNMWYKAESYIASEYAGKHLYDSGLVPIYVSDNPVLNAQHVVFEAAKGYKYGLPYHAALAAVTTAPAERLGFGQRLGKIKPGFDADIVVWDSDPLSVGAAPVQVWIDGTAQFEDPVELDKAFEGVIVPDEDLANIIEDPVTVTGDVVFTGVTKVLLPMHVDSFAADGKTFNVAISGGKITCVGLCATELAAASDSDSSSGNVIRLKNGHLAHPFTAFGSTLGLNAIDAERDTDNGGSADVFSRGADGLALDTKKLHASHRYGVTRAISAPKSAGGGGTHHGTSVGFATGAGGPSSPSSSSTKAIFADDAAIHYTLDLSAKRGTGTPTLSAAVGALRRKLLEAAAAAAADEAVTDRYSEAAFLRRVLEGELALAVTAHSADTIAAVLRVKAAVEEAINPWPGFVQIRLVIIGGAEAHLLAAELAAEGVGVVLAPMLSYAMKWDQRRALTGAPLTNGTAVDVLVGAGVVTAIGLEEDWVVRDLGLLAGIAYKNGGGRIGEREALDLAGRNVYKLLGLEEPKAELHFVVHEGNPLEIGSRVKAVGDGSGKVDIF
ncbi:hypothetical protein QBC33DRAFT_684 [Phialemonium atrogriseum]|uniref:Amidohydrolase 3 domain-containing protein n=1 Tax=Phialemonium atrogriseum TaxID=1093897 RepID=A0AAJ0FRC7_9PEZI|nr:uncharacterized protein QBC33DRAFT_684 [Phialemonium atrogriseum]KAK1772168.1 hypothetical protein QBC33DRAFT_684 [Phialemonium atrogriseum]